MIISSVYKSILRNTTDLIEQIKTTTGNSSIQYHAWEARSDENKLSPVTLIGVDGFNFEENDGLWVTRYGIGLSSYLDANLLNEIEIIDIIHERTGEGKKMNLRNPLDGSVITELVTTAWHLSPMSQSEIRNYRIIAIELLKTSNS